jgi:hypothetical protein
MRQLTCQTKSSITNGRLLIGCAANDIQLSPACSIRNHGLAGEQLRSIMVFSMEELQSTSTWCRMSLPARHLASTIARKSFVHMTSRRAAGEGDFSLSCYVARANPI